MRYFFVICFLLFNCWGCIHEKRTMMSQEMETARALFLQKDYEGAAETFSRIYPQIEKDSLQRQKVLLGLACSRMLAAQNVAQFQGALELWESWCGNPAGSLNSGDLCIFLTPMLEKWSYPEKEENPDLSRTFVDQEKELEKLRSQLRITNQKIKELNKKLKALEAISQEIDQKKKGIFP